MSLRNSKCIGIVRHGDSSEDSNAQISKIADDGDEKYRSETPITNFDARHGRIETGAVVKNRKGMSGVEAGTSTSYLWKEIRVFEKCGEGEDGSSVRSLRHETHDRTQNPEHNAATPSEPSV